jgi:hypothetical protein
VADKPGGKALATSALCCLSVRLSAGNDNGADEQRAAMRVNTHGKPHSIEIAVPRLATVVFEWRA